MATLTFQKVLDSVKHVLSQFVNGLKMCALYLLNAHYWLAPHHTPHHTSGQDFDDLDISKEACDQVDNDNTKSCESRRLSETKAREAQGHFYILPDETLMNIYGYLSVADRHRMSLIGPRFNNVAWDHTLKTATFSEEDFAVPTDFLMSHWDSKSKYSMFYIVCDIF